MRFQFIMIEVNHLLGFTLLLMLAAIMLVRRLRPQAPAFFAYVLYSAASLAADYLMVHFADAIVSWYGGWGLEAASVLLEFAVLAEIFNRLFAPYQGIRRFARTLLSCFAASLVVAALLSAIFFHEVHYTVPVLTVFLLMERTLRAIQLGFVLGLFALSKYLHLRWKNLTFGIALGFGFYALLVLAGVVVRSYYGKLVAGSMNAIEGLSYCSAVLIWVFYVFLPDIVRTPLISLPSHELERWDRALSQLLKRSSASIPASDF